MIGIVIAGPTGSGKTDLALALARELDGEVISADSRQVYRDFNAGTAKPSQSAIGKVPYHLADCANPAENYNAARFREEALKLVDAIRSRARRPIVAGGTGLYLKALLEGLSDMPSRNAEIRERLSKRSEKDLRRQLELADPAAFSTIPAGNTQRLIRALEVLEIAGKPISSFWGSRRGAASGPWLCLRLDWPIEELKRRLEGRCRQMWPALLAEVRELRRRYSGTESAFSSLGYREALLVEGLALSEDSGLDAFIRATLSYAKRQRTWFRHQIRAESIIGGPPQDMFAQALRLIRKAEDGNS